jgi:hypothetical protein
MAKPFRLMLPHPLQACNAAPAAALAWRWPGGDLVYYGDLTLELDRFRQLYPDVPLCDLTDLGEILEELRRA